MSGKGSFWGYGQRALQIISLNTLVDVIRVLQMNSYRLIKNCKHLHAERGGISLELILEKKIFKLNIIMMKNRKNFWVLSGCTN